MPLSSHKLHDRVFHSLSSRSFTLFGVRSSLSEPHICILAPRLAQRPRQPPSSPNGSAGTDAARTCQKLGTFRFDFLGAVWRDEVDSVTLLGPVKDPSANSPIFRSKATQKSSCHGVFFDIV